MNFFFVVGNFLLADFVITSVTLLETIKIWDPRTGALIREIVGHDDNVCALAIIILRLHHILNPSRLDIR